MTMESSKQPFLFVHSSGPTHVHHRGKSVQTKIRKHIMVDIGKARRKPPQNPKIGTILYLPGKVEDEYAYSYDDADEKRQSHCTSSMDDQPTVPMTPPFWEQHPLAVLEKQCGMDMFSAYGITLVLAESRKSAVGNKCASSFWFPFAFRQSAFLRQIQRILANPSTLTALYSKSDDKFKYLALERSSATIACIESRLASLDLNDATGDTVINGILAILCYNFINADFDQVLLHLKGLELLIAARGGMRSLQENNELRLKIFWVDITASLLHDLKPRFPVPSDLIPVVQPVSCSEVLPMPTFRFMKVKAVEDTNFINILSCIADLESVAILIESKLAASCDGLLTDDVDVGLRMNPVAHRLLSTPMQSTSIEASELISESLRLGAITWILWIKRRSRSHPAKSTLYVSRLLNLLSAQRAWSDIFSGSDLLSIQLWLLVLCGISDHDTTVERMTAVDIIVRKTRQLKGDSWAEIMARVRQMPWLSVMEAPCMELERLVKATR